MRITKCKACGAPIVWIKTISGKSMPCDASPQYYTQKSGCGSKKILTPNGVLISCEYTEDPQEATGTGFVPHWGTCPEADKFKK